MGLLTFPLRLPFLPMTGLVWLAQVIQEQADMELQNAIRQQLEDADFARASGQSSDEEIARLEAEAVQRLIMYRRPGDARLPSGQDDDWSEPDG